MQSQSPIDVWPTRPLTLCRVFYEKEEVHKYLSVIKYIPVLNNLIPPAIAPSNFMERLSKTCAVQLAWVKKDGLTYRAYSVHCALSLNKDTTFLILPLTLAPPVLFGWNLKWPTFYKHHCWWLDFQGQKGHIKARWVTFWPLFEIFSIHLDSPF